MTHPVEAVFPAWMTQDAAVAALIGDRVEPLVLSPGTALPAIAYQRVSADRPDTLDGPAGLAVVRLQVACWGGTYAQAKALAETVRARLKGFAGTIDNGTVQVTVTRTRLLTETDDRGDDRDDFRVLQDWQISQMED